MLTGEIGTGKTMLTHTLLQQLDRTTKTALIFTAVSNPKDLLRNVCEEFQLIPAQQTEKEVRDYLALLNRFLLESYKKGENVALVIDEAQNLSAEVLESIRLLSNFETSWDKLIQILIIGQPELATRLNSPELRQLKQRVTLRHHLLPLSPVECGEYIASRLELADGSRWIFTPEAVATIYAYSGGAPRLINILSDNGMLTAYALRNQNVDAAVIRAVAQDLQLLVLREVVSANNQVFNSGIRRIEKVVREANRFETRDTDKSKADTFPAERSAGTAGRAEESHACAGGEDNGRADYAVFPQAAPVDPVSPPFFEHMLSMLTEAMGPMATLVLDEHITALGETRGKFPKTRLAELVGSVSHEILSETLKSRFRSAIREEIRATYKQKR